MQELLSKGVIALPLLLLALSVHESAHAWAALRLGDSTAADQGRISLYPPRHLDPVGSLVLPILTLALTHGFAYGYAKPTPVDPARLRQPKRDFSLVALAGPLSNLGLALLFAGVAKLLLEPLQAPVLRDVLGWGITLNVLLGFFNLLPMPGLDGIKALYAFLPDAWCWRLNRSQPFFFMVLLLAFYLHLLDWVFIPINTAILLLCGWSGAAIPFQV